MTPSLTQLAVLLPLAAALVVAAVPRSEPALARAIGFVAALAELAVLVTLVLGFDPAGAAIQLSAYQPWLPAYGIAWSLGVDADALPMLLLIGLVTPLTLIIGGRPRRGEPPLVVGMLGLQAAWVTVVLARDLITLGAAWELAIAGTVILLGERGDGKMGVAGRTRAARRYGSLALPGAAALVAVVVLLGVGHAHASGGVWTWDIQTISQVTLPPKLQSLGLLLAVLAVAAVLPVVPVHAPLVAICVSGPTPVVAAVLGVGMPMAVHLLMRVAVPMFPLAAGEWADPLALLAVVGAIYAALVCWSEREPSRLLAHVAILHLSVAILAAVSGSAAARLALGPYLLAHGLGLVVLTTVCHSLRRDGILNLGEVAGWAAVAPKGLTFAMLAVLLLAGVPGSTGFIGELGIVVGVLGQGEPALLRPTAWALLAAASVGLGSLGLLRSLWQAGRGTPRAELRERLNELDLRERGVAVTALGLALVLGLAPGWLLRRSEPGQRAAVEALVRGRCLAIEARNQARPRTHAELGEELGAMCLDPEARIRQYYGFEDGATKVQVGRGEARP